VLYFFKQNNYFSGNDERQNGVMNKLGPFLAFLFHGLPAPVRKSMLEEEKGGRRLLSILFIYNSLLILKCFFVPKSQSIPGKLCVHPFCACNPLSEILPAGSLIFRCWSFQRVANSKSRFQNPTQCSSGMLEEEKGGMHLPSILFIYNSLSILKCFFIPNPNPFCGQVLRSSFCAFNPCALNPLLV